MKLISLLKDLTYLELGQWVQRRFHVKGVRQPDVQQQQAFIT